MKRFLIAAVAASALLSAGAAAHAQGINARQAQTEARIVQGVRGGGLTPAEANQLRAEFKGIAVLENQYRRSGGNVSAGEQADLMRRFAILDAKIYLNRIDRDYVRNWRNINVRQAEIDRRIALGIRNRVLNRAEAIALRSEFQGIARLEANYRVSGGIFTVAERRDLDRRLDLLERRIRIARSN